MGQKKFRYKELADQIQSQIEKGAFKLSEKLPSLRVLCQKTGYSMTTVFQAYVELEKRGVITSKQRSGYFIQPRLVPVRRPRIQHHKMVPEKINMDDIIHQLTLDMANPELLKLGSVAIAPEHLPVNQLHKHLKSIPKQDIPQVIAGYVHPQGDAELRHQISNLLFPYMPEISIDDIIVTSGCTEALNLCLKAVADPGNTVIVESPTDPWLRKAIKDSRLYALEVPTHPDSGIDLISVEKILERETIKACILNPNCQNPLGFIMPESRKKELLSLLAPKDIPIIENDICGDLYFGDIRPSPIKRWDTRGNVLYCSSFSKVLAPGLRVGWVMPGRFKPSVERMKLNTSLVSPALNQTLVARYLKEGTFPRHLRRLRGTLKRQHQYCAAAINKTFPETIKMTSPKGGQSIWIELPKGLNSRDVYKKARQKGISILPGFLCTNFDTFDRYIRISYGGNWDDAMDEAVQDLGAIVTVMTARD